MREILFRGQTRRYGEKVNMAGKKQPSNWVYGGIFPGTGVYSIIYDTESCEKYTVYSDTVGQYTGLKDKNGKLIFEGDILRIFEKDSGREADGVCVVHYGRFKDTDAISSFDHMGWYITVSTIIGEATTIFALEEDGIGFEIIGNIHDNPELLKGESNGE